MIVRANRAIDSVVAAQRGAIVRVDRAARGPRQISVAAGRRSGDVEFRIGTRRSWRRLGFVSFGQIKAIGSDMMMMQMMQMMLWMWMWMPVVIAAREQGSHGRVEETDNRHRTTARQRDFGHVHEDEDDGIDGDDQTTMRTVRTVRTGGGRRHESAVHLSAS
jgi:hypothetical protein